MKIAYLEAVWRTVIYVSVIYISTVMYIYESLGSNFLSAEPLLLHGITCLCRQQHSDQIKFDHWGPEKRTNHLFVVIVQQQEFWLQMADKGSEACKSIIIALQCWKSIRVGGRGEVWCFLFYYRQCFLNLCSTWKCYVPSSESKRSLKRNSREYPHIL